MEINFLQVLFQAVNFGVILFVLTKFLYKPIQNVLDERAAKINQGLKAAESNLKAEAQLEETKKKELAKAKREAAKLVSEAKKDAKLQADSMIAEAKSKASKEAAAILASAKSNAKSVEAEMTKSLKDLTVATTKKLLAESLSAKDIKNITDAMVKNLK